MQKNVALAIAAVVFGIMALVHLIRLIIGIEIIAAGYTIPIGASYLGFFLALILTIWMLMALKAK